MAKLNKKNINQIAGKREKSYRLALLALASERNDTDIVSNTDCPTSEELALLVENQTCDNFSRNALLQHISHCTHCYEEWLALSLEFSETSKKKNSTTNIRHIFLNTRNLAAAGSALAIAASITIFLAIPPEEINEAEIFKAQIQMSENIQPQKKVLLEDTTTTMASGKNKQLSSPTPKSVDELSAEKDNNKTQEFGALTGEPTPSAQQQAPKAAPSSLSKKEVKNRSRDMVFTESPLTDTPFDQFSLQILAFCSDNDAEINQSTQLHDEGQELLSNPEILAQEEVSIIEKLIKHLNQDKDKSTLCQNLLNTLSVWP